MSSLDRLFDLVLVRPPANSYVNCVSSNPQKKNIDLSLAKEQHRNYSSILRESGIRVIELRPLEKYPDSVFMQDPALIGSHRSIIGRFGEVTRRGEEQALVNDINTHNIDVGEMDRVDAPGTLEGGDIAVTDRGVFVGQSQRSNAAGIKRLKRTLTDCRVISIRIDAMHLLCGCSYLSNGHMIIAPDVVDPQSFPGFHFIAVPTEEAYATDALYLGERRVLIPAGFPTASRKLKDGGYTPVEVEMSEFYKGDGGVTCLSSPVYKIF
jgi:dimethylargininase